MFTKFCYMQIISFYTKAKCFYLARENNISDYLLIKFLSY